MAKELIFASHWERGMESNTVPKFVHCRVLVQMLAALSIIAAEDGKAQEAADMLERGFRFPQTLPSDLLVTHMIRQACAGLTANVAEHCLNRASFNEAQLTRLADSIPPPSTSNLINSLRGEHCLAIWAFQETKRGRHDLMPHFVPIEPWWKTTLRRMLPHPNEYNDHDFVTYLSFCRPSLDALALPPAQAVTNFTALMSAYSKNVSSEIGLAVPANWTKALRAHYECEAKLDVLRTVLAVERFRLAHGGKPPQTLSELVPKYSSEVPRDIFDNQPLRFRTLPRGYVVYSIGADLVDDGGVEKATSTTTNYDVTIIVER